MQITKIKFKDISNIAIQNNIFGALIFGQNNGLTLELSNDVFADFKFDLKYILTEEEILSNNDILFSSIAVDDFFAEKRLIKIYNITNKFYDILQQIYNTLEKRKDVIKICLIGNEIQAKTKIRTFFENNDNLISACCYFDEIEDAKTYIIEYFGVNNIKYDNNLISFLSQNLYGDRRILKNELEKIKLSFLKEKEKVITIDDVKNIIENQTIDNVFEFIDLFAIKNKNKSIITLNKVLETEETTFIGLLHLLYRHFQNLSEICCRIESKKTSLDNELLPFFFKRKILIKKQIEIWRSENIHQMIHFISNLEASTISFGESFAKQLLINKIIKF